MSHDLNQEYEEAVEKVGTQFCVACYVNGLVEEGEPSITKMAVRWSLLGERPFREDIQVKCPSCKDTRTHGFGLARTEFEEKLERRGKKFLDVATDDIRQIDEEHLRDLGYIP